MSRKFTTLALKAFIYRKFLKIAPILKTPLISYVLKLVVLVFANSLYLVENIEIPLK